MNDYDVHKYDYLHMEDMDVWSYREKCYCSACSDVRREREAANPSVSIETYLEKRSIVSVSPMTQLQYDGLKKIEG